MSFSRYAAIVKNLRGVMLFNMDEEGVEASIHWLVKRFRYRNLGLTPALLVKYKGRLSRYLHGNPFRELVPPVPAVSNLVHVLQKHLEAPVEVLELLVYASTYVSPGIVVGNTYRGYLEKYSASTVHVCREMSINDWKLHMRIADYTVLDFYLQCVDEVLEPLAVRNIGELQRIVGERRARIEKDRKRYWRVLCESGTPFLYYIDVLELAVKYNALDELEQDHAAGLAIVPVIYVPPGLN
ncbi:MAG: hypothetical protein QXR80_06210 [Desulfurococcaceae archaeon]